MIKKVVVSAAGQGTRMLSLSENKSKHLICVQQKPFLAYLLDNIFQAGYKEIILVVGFREDMIREFLKNYRFDGAMPNIQIVNQFDILGPKEKEYGTACPIKCVKNLIKNENFISLVGDNFYTVDELKAMNVDDEFCYVAGLKQEHPEKFGVLIEDGGDFLEKIIEKPKEFVGNLVNTSLYKFTPEIFEKVFEIEKSPRGEYEITDAISLLAKEKKVKIKKINNFWMDFGRPEDIEKLCKYLENENCKNTKKSDK
ncbi:MAG: sugar phosphate nucleotidyltransferase [Candidatus Staskawiczbacteria bacterium]|jgi:bifunctional UDP-N-acetylglucosamine pyrophosphorylase/glucosamine-1-phosphate N-acetyltransferase